MLTGQPPPGAADAADESPHFLVDDTLQGLAQKMNALTALSHAGRNAAVLQATADAFDANFANGSKLHNDDQIRRILHARQWGPDKLRTCKPAPLQMKGAGPFIAIHMQLITRKSLGGLQTDLHSRVLDAARASPCPACTAWARPPALAAVGPMASARWKAPSCPAASSRRVLRRGTSLRGS
jgi:predicted oxidoreductase